MISGMADVNRDGERKADRDGQKRRELAGFEASRMKSQDND
jgi:hypothetical protein